MEPVIIVVKNGEIIQKNYWGGKTEEEWLIRCIRLAPNAPEQNPIEDVWLQGKEMVRKYWNLCHNFKIVKWVFSWTINQGLFDFPKLSMYGSFS